MLRKTMIVLLTAAALTGVLTADAFARGGGGGIGGGGHTGGGFEGWRSYGRRVRRRRSYGRRLLAEAISPVVAWLSVAALRSSCRGARPLRPRSLSSRRRFHRGFGFGGGYDDWCYEYPFYTNRIAICMGTDVLLRPASRHGRELCRTGHLYIAANAGAVISRFS